MQQNHGWFRPAPISFCSTRIGSIPTETKEARFTPARSGDLAAYRRWTGPTAPPIEIFSYLDVPVLSRSWRPSFSATKAHPREVDVSWKRRLSPPFGRRPTHLQ